MCRRNGAVSIPSPFRGNGGNPPWKASRSPALGERKKGGNARMGRRCSPPEAEDCLDSETNIGIQALDRAKPARRRRDRPESMRRFAAAMAAQSKTPRCTNGPPGDPAKGDGMGCPFQPMAGDAVRRRARSARRGPSGGGDSRPVLMGGNLMDLNQFWSWESLATFAGATACTGLCTQLLKRSFGKLPTQWLSYILAALLLTVTTAATGGWTQPWTVWALVPLNAVLVSLASNGAFQAVTRVQSRGPTEG